LLMAGGSQKPAVPSKDFVLSSRPLAKVTD
jgi:hypothetical protein